MDNIQDKKRIDWTNDIILLNDKYADKGLYANASVKAEAVILLQQAAVFLSV